MTDPAVTLPSREAAWALLCEWTPNANLRKHMLAVEAAMRGYARRFGEDEHLWGLVGLLHDLDYERYPSQEAGHPFRGVEHLRSLGYPEVVCRAILSHADYTGVPRRSRMEHALHACDELTGFIVAVALVRPSRSLHEVDPPAVRRKMRDKAFARAVRRDELVRAAESLGVPFDEHVAVVVEAMRGIADELDLDGRPGEPGA
ncbi:MAG: HDIG domain-containing protein [Armatimonadota bacterium]|nr:HDIG domain-containing protein [Armatimonadota bacterium]